jgi:hypothetical protein
MQTGSIAADTCIACHIFSNDGSYKAGCLSWFARPRRYGSMKALRAHKACGLRLPQHRSPMWADALQQIAVAHIKIPVGPSTPSNVQRRLRRQQSCALTGASGNVYQAYHPFTLQKDV